MWSKIIFVVATLCVVNASVITVNVFDDQPDTLVGKAVEDCNWRACDQLCRRLGFPSGVCVNGRCKCDNFKRDQDQAETPVGKTVEDCNWRACDQLCRRLGFPSGVCVNGRCKCDNFKGAQAFTSIIDDYVALRSCNPQECDQRCRRLKFPGGACVNGRCKCDNFRRNDDDFTLKPHEVIRGGCNYRMCNQHCMRLGYAGGVCVNDRCKCKDIGKVKESDLKLEEPVSFSSCDNLKCQRECLKIGFRGSCVAGRCQCIGLYSDGLEAASDEVEKSEFLNEDGSPEDVSSVMQKSPRSCNPQECNQRCRRLKFPGGACVNGRCKCDNFRNSDGIVIEATDSVLEPNVYTIFGSCKPEICTRLCLFLHFKSGTCINGRCQCSKSEGSTNSTTEKPVAEEDAKPVDDTINKEVEESNEILNEDNHHEESEDSNLVVNEEDNAEGHHERIARATCYEYKCNDRCIRVGYAIGLCRKHKCKCY